MSGSTGPEFGSGAVGSSVLPCPLGHIHVEVVLEDGRPADVSVPIVLSGPDSLEASVPRGNGRWSSPKILPGAYQIEVPADRAPAAYQPAAPYLCELPESGAVTARLVLRPYGSLTVEAVRRGTTQGVGGLAVALTIGGSRVELKTAADGTARFTQLPTVEPQGNVEITLGASAGRYEPPVHVSTTLTSGANPPLRIELVPLGALRISVVDSQSSTTRVPARIKLTATGGGRAVDADTDSRGEAEFIGLAAGTYRVEAVTVRPEDDGYIVDSVENIELQAGEEKPVTLEAKPGRSWIVMSDKASQPDSRGVLRDLIGSTYSTTRDDLKRRNVRSSSVTLPVAALQFDDVPFDAAAWYWDDAKEVIAVTGSVEAGGVKRQVLFAHTYRPNRLLLALKFAEWKFDRDWVKVLIGPMTQHLNMSNAFVVLSATETDIKSADLPDGVASFFGEEELDLKQGVNLYGKLDISGFPSLEQLLGWMGIKETYVKIEGYLAHDANFVFSKEASEKKQPHESVWELTLSGSIPWPILAPWDKLIKERELTLEIGLEKEVKGYPAGGIYNKGSAIRKRLTGKDAGKTAQEIEKKIHVKIEDAIKIPLPTLAVPWLVVVNEDKDVEFTGSFQVEQDWEVAKKKAKESEPASTGGSGATAASPAAASDAAPTTKAGDQSDANKGTEKEEKKGDEKKDGEKKEDDKKGPEWSLEYGTDLTIALFAKEVAIHDFKAEINLSEDKLTLSGEIDLGRREKVATVEFERPLPKSKKPATPAGVSGGSAPSGSVESGPSTPPKPSLNLEEKQNKPQPEAPTQSELDQASKDKPAKKQSPWSVTVKVKPGVLIGMVDIVKDLGAFLASHTGAES